MAYVAPTPTASPLPRATSTLAPASLAATPEVARSLPTETPTLSAVAAPTGTATPIPPTAPPTVAPTATAQQKPRVVAADAANVRAGPGTNYPAVGKLTPGKEMDIIGRNTSGDWWRIAWEGFPQAWVAGLVVNVLGPIDTVAVAADVPPPPTSPPAPPTVPPAPTSPPKPAVDFVIKAFRLRSVGENSQECNGGNHNIFVRVLDKAGNPLDGVRIRDIWRQQNPDLAHDAIKISGTKGPGGPSMTPIEAVVAKSTLSTKPATA